MTWTDRRGRPHEERRPAPHVDEPRMLRVVGPFEQAWALAEDGAQEDDGRGERARLARDVLARPNPITTPDPDDPDLALWTWVVEDAEARSIALWTNAVFDHDDVANAEFRHLEGSALWTICLRLPAALRTSYRIAVWREDGPPPWRTAVGRRAVILAAMGAAVADERCHDAVRGSRGELSSVGAGPGAPADPVRPHRRHDPRSRLDELALPAGERAWVYTPPQTADTLGTTPLLVLFDGQVWRGMGIRGMLDAAIADGTIPPLHVALLDSGSQEHRWQTLGVPGAQVDVVLDGLLPAVRAGWNVDARGEATSVSGQSLGGIAALWTLALGEGEIAHAIAQSPSLWRFDIAEALIAEPGWRTIELQAGAFERDMLADAEALESALRADPRIGRRTVHTVAAQAGHDWAVWRTGLMTALATTGEV